MVERDKVLPKTLFPFIWHFLRDYKPVVIVFTLLAVAAGLWRPLNSMLIKYIINLLPHAHDGDISILRLPASLIVVNFIVFDNFTWRGINYIRCKFTPLIINRIIGESMDYVLGKSHQFYQDNLSGKISKQITNLADGIEILISRVAPNFLRGASLLLATFVAAYSVNSVFYFVLVIWFIFFASASIMMSKKLVHYLMHRLPQNRLL